MSDWANELVRNLVLDRGSPSGVGDGLRGDLASALRKERTRTEQSERERDEANARAEAAEKRADQLECERDAARTFVTRVAELEALLAWMRRAIEFFFTPGPGCAMPVKHDPDYRDPSWVSWNAKLDRLQDVLASDAGRAAAERMRLLEAVSEWHREQITSVDEDCLCECAQHRALAAHDAEYGR